MTKFCDFGLSRLAVVVGCLLCGFIATAPVAAQSIWFSPHPGFRGASDYLELFRPDAPWQRAASQVEVLETGGRFLIDAPEADVRQIFSDLKRRKIGLEIGVEPLSGLGPNHCGYHVEGYGGPLGGGIMLAQRLKALGAEPRFFGMDEPLYFGHVFGSEGGRIGCHSSIADLARDVAGKIRQVRTVYPGIQFGEAEPLTFRPGDPWFKNDAWLSDLSEWFDAYQAAVGDKVAFLRLDLWWGMPWQQHMPALTALLARKGIPLQIIYNGDGQDRTDESWIASAIAHFKAFETGPWPKPAAAVIQYWTPNPTHVLPESNPLTATGLILRYVQWQQTRR